MAVDLGPAPNFVNQVGDSLRICPLHVKEVFLLPENFGTDQRVSG